MSDATDRLCWLVRAVLQTAVVIAAVAPWPAASYGQYGPLQIHGYAKNLAIGSSSIIADDTRFLNVSRLRLKGTFDAGSGLRGELWLDTEALAGSFLDAPEYVLSQAIERPTWLDLDWSVHTASRFILQQGLFRAFVSYYAGPATVTIGRQRIAWGTGFAWNPTDLFNPFNPAAIELGEKSGIDAIHLAVATGDFSRAEVAYAPGSEWRRSSVAGRMSTKVGEYDVSAMGGFFQTDWTVGGDFAGYLGDAGLRGEVAITVPDAGSAYTRFTITVDRSFGSSYYGFIEYYFNGQGARDKSQYDFSELLTGRAFNVARDYAALSVAKTVTPLLGLNVYGLVNLDDRSALAGPAMTYSLGNNSEVGAAVYAFVGKNDTEFGRQKNAYFAYVQFFF